jgi:hypothetical protein
VAFGSPGKSVGTFATDVTRRLCDRLADARPAFEWEREYRLGSTPADVGGQAADRLALVELEWRRADPADNAAKLFRHAVEGSIDADRIVLFQVFTRYYDLTDGGISSKRLNAEFVGRMAADAIEGLSYHPLELDLTPPKRGSERPAGWQETSDAAAGAITDRL